MTTILQALTAEFAELERVTHRPLTHEDYAITAIQFHKELGNFDLQDIVTEQQQTIEELQEKVDYWEGKSPFLTGGAEKDENKNASTENDRFEIWCDIIDFIIKTRLTGSTWKELDSKYSIGIK